MATPSFYSPDLALEIVESDNPVITLSENESSHAVRSRRLREGQEVNLLNGDGVVAKGAIFEINKRAVSVKVFDCQKLEKTLKPLTIASAIPKGDRQKVMVDMLTQLGVSEIIPLNCEHSVTRYSDNLGEKWQRAAIESCKQSQNPWLPVIAKSHNVEQLLKLKGYHVVYADADGSSMNLSCDMPDSNMLVVIGPEGGLSSNEITCLAAQGVKPVSLGPHILRTEAAAISAAAQFVSLNK